MVDSQHGHSNELKQEFIEWYCMPLSGKDREMSTETQWARAHGIPQPTVARWKKAPWFREQVERIYAQLNISPERIQDVVQAMHAQAKGGDVKAATLYLQYVDKLAPKRVVIEDRRVSDMSDEELRQAFEQAMESDNG